VDLMKPNAQLDVAHTPDGTAALTTHTVLPHPMTVLMDPNSLRNCLKSNS